MAEWSELLRVEGSLLAKLLRCQLAGLAASLRAAQSLAPDDPGQDACSRLVAALEAGPTPAPTPTPTPVAATGSLMTVRQQMLASAELRAELGAFGLPESPDEALWQQANLLLLHVSPPLASRWQEELKRAAGPSANDDCDTLAFDREELVFPGWGRPTRTKGLRLSARGSLDERLAAGPFSGVSAVLAQVVTVALWLTDHDPELQHCLKTVYRFGLMKLAEPQRGRVQRAMIERLERLRQTEQAGDAAETLRAWVDLDEAIHSVRSGGPGSAASWWARIQKRGRDTMPAVREAALGAGHQVHLQVLTGRYADVTALSEEDRMVEAAVAPGDVAVCLRVYLRLNGQAHPGRVLYRPR